MGKMAVSGSIKVYLSNRDVTNLDPGFITAPLIQRVYAPTTVYSPYDQSSGPEMGNNTLILPWAADSGYTEPLGTESGDDDSQGLTATVGAAGIVSSTTAGLLIRQGAFTGAPQWMIWYYPGQDLLPTWASDRVNPISIEVPANYYGGPVFTVWDTDIGDFTSGSWSPPIGFGIPAGDGILLLVSQAVPRTTQNGLWVVTAGGPSGFTLARTSDWSTWLAAWSDASGRPNSLVLIYDYLGNSSAPYLVGGPTEMWLLDTADGTTWTKVFGGFIHPIQYHKGQQVFANNDTSYLWAGTYSALGPNPIDSSLVTPFSWTPTDYQTDVDRSIDVGTLQLTFDTQIAAVLALGSPGTVDGYQISLYACIGEDRGGSLVGSFTPQQPAYLYSEELAPNDGYVSFDYFLGGDGTQNYYDGNPVTFSFEAPGYESFGVFITDIAGASGPYPPGTPGATIAADLTDSMGGEGSVFLSDDYTGYVFGKLAQKAAQIGCYGLTCQVFGATYFQESPLSGTSVAWWGNIYILPNETGTTAAALQKAISATAPPGSSIEVSPAGSSAFQVTIRSSVDPNPQLSGMTLRSPWRAVVTFPNGNIIDSYSPVNGSATVFARGLAGSTNNFAFGSTDTMPPSAGIFKYWLLVRLLGSGGGSGSTTIPTTATSIANDLYRRPIIAIDNGDNTTSIAVTHDAGQTWETHPGPAGSLPTIVVDQRSNASIVAVNDAGAIKVYHNPDADWYKSTHTTLISSVTGSAGAAFGQPTNRRHVLLAFVDGSGNLNVNESLDFAASWSLRSTVTAGMPADRGLCAGIVWVEGSIFIVYSQGATLYCQRSVNGGSNWAAPVAIDTGYIYTQVTVIEHAHQILVYGMDNTGSSTPWHLWQSSDLGANFTDITNSSTPQPAAGSPAALGIWSRSGKLLISGSNLG